MLEWDFGRIPKISNNLKTDEYFCQNLDSIWQKAICRRPCTFHLAIFTEFLYLAYFIQGSVFLGHPVENDTLMKSEFLVIAFIFIK